MEMRPTFLLTTELKPVSALITKEVRDGIPLHTCVELVREFETPYGKIPAGTKGFVDFVDPENGAIELFMDGHPPALLHWGNILILVPFRTDDLAECIRITPPPAKTDTQKRIEMLERSVPQVANG